MENYQRYQNGCRPFLPVSYTHLFQEAKQRFIDLIGTEASRFRFLVDSDRLTLDDKERYKALIAIKNGAYSMSNQVVTRSLKTLSELLNKYYDQKTVILIDEYDVPLDKAFQQGYYRERCV